MIKIIYSFDMRHEKYLDPGRDLYKNISYANNIISKFIRRQNTQNDPTSIC